MRRAVLVLAVVAVLIAIAQCRRSSGPPAKPVDAAAPSTGPTRSDELLLAAAKVALPPPGLAPGDLPDPTSREASLVVKYCTQCHALPTPTAHSATDWPSVARRMWLRMEWLPPSLSVEVPTPAERYSILTYMLANALKVSGSVLPAGKGRDEFSIVCSQCHALPDPRVHSADDWPTVYSRMERNMDRMKVQPPGASASADILLYLQTVAGKRPPRRG
jgi:hypothetical protein